LWEINQKTPEDDQVLPGTPLMPTVKPSLSSLLNQLSLIWNLQTKDYKVNIIICLSYAIVSRLAVAIYAHFLHTPVTEQQEKLDRIVKERDAAEPGSRRRQILDKYASKQYEHLLLLHAAPSRTPGSGATFSLVQRLLGFVPMLFFTLFRENRIVMRLPLQPGAFTTILSLGSGMQNPPAGSVSYMMFLMIIGRPIGWLIRKIIPPAQRPLTFMQKMQGQMLLQGRDINGVPLPVSQNRRPRVHLKPRSDLKRLFPDIVEMSETEGYGEAPEGEQAASTGSVTGGVPGDASSTVADAAPESVGQR